MFQYIIYLYLSDTFFYLIVQCNNTIIEIYNSTLFHKYYVFDDGQNKEIRQANSQNKKHLKFIFF